MSRRATTPAPSPALDYLESRLLLSLSPHTPIHPADTAPYHLDLPYAFHGTASGLSVAIPVFIDSADGSHLLDASGNVTLSLLSGPGSLTGTTTLPFSQGSLTFVDLQFSQPGTYTLQASSPDLLHGSPVAPATITVTPGIPFQLAFLQQPAPTIAGLPTSATIVAGNAIAPFTIAAEDPYNNIASSASGTVTLSPNPASAASFSASLVNGIATFANVTLTHAGTVSLTAADTPDNLAPTTSDPFTIVPAAPTHLAFLDLPATFQAGTNLTLQVAIEDAFNNLTTNHAALVSLAAATGPAPLAGTLSASGDDAFFGSLHFNLPGTYTLAATDPADNFSLTSDPITVTPAIPSHIAFTQQPSTVAANVPFTTQLTLTDDFGNPADATVSLSIERGAGGLLGGTTHLPSTRGLASFSNLTLTAPGTYTLAASVGNLLVDSSTIQVDATPVHLALLQPPARTLPAGTPFSATVQLLDKTNTLAAAIDAAATVSLRGPAGAQLLGNTTVTITHGLATFSNLAIHKAGAYTLRFTDGSLRPLSLHLTITPDASHAQLLLLRPPAPSVPAGSPLSPNPIIEAIDPYGNLLTTSHALITLTIPTNPAALKTTPIAKLQHGLATFKHATLLTPGTYTLQATTPTLPPLTFPETVTPAASPRLPVLTLRTNFHRFY